MKKIGLIGGMSWESTKVYYELLNKMTKEKLGKFHSAKCVIDSVDFEEIVHLQHKNDWDSLHKIMVESAKNLEKAKAEAILICTNTMHLSCDEISKNVSIPLIHIAEATGKKIQNKSISKVLLLGTKFTMEKDFYKSILKNKFNIDVSIPNEEDRMLIHNIIYNELVKGIFKKESKKVYKNIIEKAIKKGAKGVILGCTEIPLLIKPSDVSITVFDTTKIHAESAIEFSLS
jgi:aspartate racemase